VKEAHFEAHLEDHLKKSLLVSGIYMQLECNKLLCILGAKLAQQFCFHGRAADSRLWAAIIRISKNDCHCASLRGEQSFLYAVTLNYSLLLINL
jgi:hypothetical protein